MVKSYADKILSSVKDLIEHASFDRTFKAKVTAKVSTGIYKVSKKNVEYKVKSYFDLVVGDFVWVCVPSGDWDAMFVQSYSGFHDRVITTNNIVNNYSTNVPGTVLDGRMGNTIKAEIDGKLSLSGGTVNGLLYTTLGCGVYRVSKYSAGQTGYINFCRITITEIYKNQPIKFKIIQRGTNGGELTVRFSNSNSLDPSVDILSVSGNLTEIQIKKYNTSNWDLYIKKSEAYDSIDIVDFQMGGYMSSTNIKWKDEFFASNPGGIVATVV